MCLQNADFLNVKESYTCRYHLALRGDKPDKFESPKSSEIPQHVVVFTMINCELRFIIFSQYFYQHDFKN